VAVALALAGCDKPPTFSELINGKQKEAPAPASAAKTPAEITPPVVAKEPPKPEKTAQELVAAFEATPSQQRTDAQLIEMAGKPEAAGHFTELDLTSSGVTDAGVAVLPKFENVAALSIGHCQCSNKALSSVAQMKSLTALYMSGGLPKDATCDAGLAALKSMHELTSLSLEGANVTMAGLTGIGQMVWLEKLDVAHNRFNDDNLEQLKSLVHLKELDISDTSVSDNGFRLIAPFRELELLKIAHLPIHGEGLKELGRRKSLPRLRRLVMSSNPNLELTAYQGLYLFRGSLVGLDVSGSACDDTRFHNSVVPLSKLEELALGDNPGLSDFGMQSVTRLGRLQKLYIYKNSGISDQTLAKLAKMNSLKSVNLLNTSCTQRGVAALKAKRPNCEIIFNGKTIE
jgi:internalin A